eukprot:TRINITY_DN74803_c0_g1_i1.p1 TRINITY_DN74803_c0_g1~~TRINITY_DN74803_c0_g1_i1.p1  ORF type:complete len:594 (+),score=85.95 TRINITY_DN74803_c0_g1_i1:37-1818(+)
MEAPFNWTEEEWEVFKGTIEPEVFITWIPSRRAQALNNLFHELPPMRRALLIKGCESDLSARDDVEHDDDRPAGPTTTTTTTTTTTSEPTPKPKPKPKAADGAKPKAKPKPKPKVQNPPSAPPAGTTLCPLCRSFVPINVYAAGEPQVHPCGDWGDKATTGLEKFAHDSVKNSIPETMYKNIATAVPSAPKHEWVASTWANWLQRYKALQHWDAVKNLRRLVIEYTMDTCAKGLKGAVDPKKTTQSIKFDPKMGGPPPPKDAKRPQVRVYREDCVLVAEMLQKEGLDPCMLNMACGTTPGGGFLTGAGAQEENLHRRSNYHRATLEHKADMYPLDEFGGLYTAGITFFRGTEAEGYPFNLDNPTVVDCVAVAAYRHPPLKWDDNGRPSFRDSAHAVGMKKKIELIFRTAKEKGNNALVLGAFGCGAFRNPVDQVAHIFQTVVQELGSWFKVIAFAILGDENSSNHVNPEGLLFPFCKAFGVMPATDANCGRCRFGGMCIWQGNAPHCNQLEHPPPCRDAGTCDNTTHRHRVHYAHPPHCKYGSKCKDLDKPAHCQGFCHPPKCPMGGKCVEVHTNPWHVGSFLHPPRKASGSA